MGRYILLLISLTLVSSVFGQTRSRVENKKEKPKPIKVDGIPEGFPFEVEKQRKWFLKWMFRDKVPVSMYPKFIGILTQYKETADEAISKEKDRSKPRKSRLRYYKQVSEWYEEQITIATSIKDSKAAIFPLLPSKHPTDLQKRKDLETKIEEQFEELKDVLKKKPSKPE